MSSEKIAPMGLKHQECEHGRSGEKAPIRYMPEQDPVQEALELKPESMKCTFTNGSETRVTVWSGHGTNEQFLLHVNKVASVAKNMGLYSAFDDAKAAHDSKKDDIKAVLMELAKINEADSPNVAEAEKKTAVLLKAEVVNLKKKMTTAAQAVFQLYANLLAKEVHQPWDIIVKEQTESLPYTNIYGVECRKSPGKTTS